MTEKNFEIKVKKYLRDNKIFYVKFFGCGITTSGIPDLLCCVNGYFLAIELKTEKGRVSELQKYKIEEIKKSNGRAIVLRPFQFEDFKKYIKTLKELDKKL